MKKNSPTILSVVGVIGTITSTVLAVKATPKAINLIHDEEFVQQRQLSKKEIVKITWKEYIPTGISLLATISSIFGANFLNRRNQTSLVAAYSVLENSYKQYKDHVNKIYGEDADKRVLNSIVKEYHDYSNLIQNDDKKLFFDYNTMRYFESTFDDVLAAEKKVNEELAATGYVSINEFYNFLNLDPLAYANHIGWCDNGDYHEITFEHERIEMDDGLECWIIISSDALIDFFN